MKCCNHDCDQGDRCPIRQAGLSRPTATSQSSSSAHPPMDDEYFYIDDFMDDTSVLLQGIALLGFVVAALMCASLWL
jgi:hypothetical protein